MKTLSAEFNDVIEEAIIRAFGTVRMEEIELRRIHGDKDGLTFDIAQGVNLNISDFFEIIDYLNAEGFELSYEVRFTQWVNAEPMEGDGTKETDSEYRHIVEIPLQKEDEE